MATVTVKQLAETVKVPVDRLLKQMQEAGLEHNADGDLVSEVEKQQLLGYLQKSHGESQDSKKKITLKRKSTGTIKQGQGRAGRDVTVEVRRKRTYVKKQDVVDVSAENNEEPTVKQAEVEVRKIHEEESARQEAEEKARLEKEEALVASQRKAEKKIQEEADKKKQEELIKNNSDEQKTGQNSTEKVANAAEVQAQVQAAEKGNRRTRSKDKNGDAADEFGDGKGKRRELSLKSRRKVKSKPTVSRKEPLQVEQQGGEFKPTEFISREVEMGEFITVGELAQGMAVKAGEVIKALIGLGVMATINQALDQDTATLVAEEMGHKIRFKSADALEEEYEASLDIEGDLISRAPIITVMGHVDHGKTSLLDYIRDTRVTSGEAGGITQHIGAYRVNSDKGELTFIDTPGHAAFTAMRARGAKVTDLVILVVAADDGVMPQTEEAIQHANAAEVPLIVAINKIDLENADPEKVTNELAAKNVVPEGWGGDTQFINVSAISGEGVDELLEAVHLQAEIMELKAVLEAPGQGVVIESSLDRGRGAVSTLLVKNGTLSKGDVVIAGEYYGKVRAMIDDQGANTDVATAAMPVEILGLNGTPEAGDDFSVVANEKRARELAEFRSEKVMEQKQALQKAAKLENAFLNMSEGEKRVLKLIIKADVRGSLEAILQAVSELGNDEVSVQVLGSGVGGISGSDSTLSVTYGASIFGFNVRADKTAKILIEKEGVDLRYYSVIYELIDDIKSILSGMLAPEIREEIVGIAEVRDVFRSPRFGSVAGCMVSEGTVYRNKPIRVLRENVVIYEGELESLRRFKDDVGEVRNGIECGIGVRNYNDVKVGDLIEVFEVKEIARTIQ
jgi:translation initiation factor IF-2